MVENRRNDVGWKIAVATITLILALFFNAVYQMGVSAKLEANANTVMNARQEEKIDSIKDRIVRIDKNTESILDKLELLR